MDHMIVVPINRKQDHTQSPSAYIGHFAEEEEGWLVGPGKVYQQFLGPEHLDSPAIRVTYHNQGTQGAIWETKFTQLRRLREGWNGYTAPAPSEKAIITAKIFVEALLRERYEPKRVAASSVGGVGITHRRRNKTVYVEFYNDGRVLALFSDDVSEPTIKRVEPVYRAFKELIAEMRDYLDA